MAAVRRRRRSGRWSGLAVLVGALVLAGCGGGDEPEPDLAPTATTVTQETPTASPEPTAGPGPTPWPAPTRPATMERDDIEGAKAAAEYFLSLYPYVYATGDLDVWREMSHPECEFCRSVDENVDRIFGDGGYALGGEIAVEEIVAAPPDDEYPHFRVGIHGAEEPSDVYSADGEIEVSTSGGRGTYSFAVLREGSSWTIRGVFAESEGE